MPKKETETIDIIREQRLQRNQANAYKTYVTRIETDRDYRRILKIAFNPEEFQRIWNSVPPLAKLTFIQQSMKYVFEDKKNQNETTTITLYDKIMQS